MSSLTLTAAQKRALLIAASGVLGAISVFFPQYSGAVHIVAYFAGILMGIPIPSPRDVVISSREVNDMPTVFSVHPAPGPAPGSEVEP